MRTFSTIEGFPVLVKSTGQECGHITDLVYKNGKIIGLLIDPKGLLARQRFLAVSDVDSFGPDAIMIESAEQLKPFEKTDSLLLKHGKERLQGIALLTNEGEKLGLMEDVYFHEEVGTIVGYEVTDGLIADLMEGRKVVKSDKQLTITKGRAIMTE
ncbi:PRC-barrel domain-containing protein [Bacillus sp. JCM 19034]|uniref:PRC-barrel domain-containing protein n=1 Tax=Bacillus sp. JCM 19034 TaxID=1481928 RepID=UPI0007859D53|nr:PRC-barrel domain-containing protein [Bacillus sp. JCM 19034]